jgi:hypothetical protein
VTTVAVRPDRHAGESGTRAFSVLSAARDHTEPMSVDFPSAEEIEWAAGQGGAAELDGLRLGG